MGTVHVEFVNDDLGETVRDFDLSMHPTQHEVETNIVECYAGQAAHLHFAPNRAEQAAAGSWDDDEKAAEFMKLLEEPSEAALRKRAHELVVQHWTKIEALAAELLTQRSIDGDEVELIIQGAAD